MHRWEKPEVNSLVSLLQEAIFSRFPWQGCFLDVWHMWWRSCCSAVKKNMSKIFCSVFFWRWTTMKFIETSRNSTEVISWTDGFQTNENPSDLCENCDWKHLAVQVLFVQLSAGYGDYPKRLLHLFGCRQSTCGGVDTVANQPKVDLNSWRLLQGNLKFWAFFFLIVFSGCFFFFSLLSILNLTDLFFCFFFGRGIWYPPSGADVKAWRVLRSAQTLKLKKYPAIRDWFMQSTCCMNDFERLPIASLLIL